MIVTETCFDYFDVFSPDIYRRDSRVYPEPTSVRLLLAPSGPGSGGTRRHTTAGMADEMPLMDAIIAAVKGLNRAAKLLPPGREQGLMDDRKYDLLRWTIVFFEDSGLVYVSYQAGQYEPVLLVTLFGSDPYSSHVPVSSLAGEAHRVVVSELGVA